MASTTPEVVVDLKALHRFQTAIPAGLISMNGPIHSAFIQWAARYRGFAQERFDIFSKGGGDWPALAKSTVKRRRQGKQKKETWTRSSLARDTSKRGRGRLVRAGGVFSILRDTGKLFDALEPGFVDNPGGIRKRLHAGIRVGYGGPGKYPDGGPTIADIASFHQTGSDKLPKREIIVDPDAETVQLMVGDMERALRKLGNEKGNEIR